MTNMTTKVPPAPLTFHLRAIHLPLHRIKAPMSFVRASLAGAALAVMLHAALGAEPFLTQAGPQQRLPNIIHIMTDDQGWTDVNYMGHRHRFPVQTPNLDEMAANGLVFTRFYAPSAVCTPSRVSITMGRHCTRYGVMTVGGCSVEPFNHPRDLPCPKGNITTAEGLKTKGYTTAHIGKAHGASTKGMDASEVIGNSKCDDPHCTDSGIKFIRKAVADKKPFYLRLWLSAGHSPFRPAQRFLDLYPKNAYPDRGPVARWATISEGDEQVGRVRKELRALGVAENTLLWFSSDNGGIDDQSGALRGHKGNLYEGGIRVPGIIEYPALIKKASRTDIPVSGLDILPTIFDLTGVPLPQYEIDGLSLMPLLNGEMKERRKNIPFWYIHRRITPSTLQFAIIGDRYKLLTNLDDKKNDELYDIPADMAEKRNLAAEHPEIVARLRDEMKQWKKSVEASMAGNDAPAKSASQQ